VQSTDVILQQITPAWNPAPTEILAANLVPQTTTTPLPPVDPTPFGGTVVVGDPLPTAKPAEKVINKSNVYQLEELTSLGEPKRYGVSGALFTQDGERLVVARDNYTVWQLPEANLLYSLPITSTNGKSLALSPDGQTVAIGNHEILGRVELWDLETQEQIREHRGGRQVMGLGFNAAGTILAAGRTDGSVTIWDVETGNLTHHLSNGWTGCYGMAVHPELDQIATSGDDNSVQIWDAQNGQLLTELSIPNLSSSCELSSLVYRPDGGMLAGAMFWEQSIALWEEDTYYGTLTHPDSGTVSKISWSPDGKLLAAIENGGGSRDGQQLVLWDVETKTVIRIWEQWSSIATFSPDGTMLVTGSYLPSSGVGLSIMAIPERIYFSIIFK